MGLIFTKGSDKTLILSPREAFMRQFDFGDDWTEMRLGMILSVIGTSSSNSVPVNETVALSTNADRFTFGIKDDSDNLPGAAGSLFLGVTTPEADGSQLVANLGGGSGLIRGTGSQALSGGSFNGETADIKAGVSQLTMAFFSDPTGGVYTFFYGVKLVIADRGLATQTVAISGSFSQTVAGAETTAEQLRTFLNNATYTTAAAALDWNDGNDAYDIPDSFWVRLPFFNNRLRISAMRAIRYV